jgi:phosphoribosylaminoimidazole-succinocarboxamide synthase
MSASWSGNLMELNLPLFRHGKVRDTFELDDELLMVASDRISAFDVIMPTEIPDKGKVLNQLSAYWFGQTSEIIQNHVISSDPENCQEWTRDQKSMLSGRSMLVRRCERIDIECVVRGYLSGSGWTEYSHVGTLAGITLPTGLVESGQLSSPTFTPAMKADSGHDENISFAQMQEIVGSERASLLKETSIALYQFAASKVREKGLILADTKFEFGLRDGELILIDEILTPDSSRYWELATYEPGRTQESFDKQYLRNWLLGTDWNREPPGPVLPPEVVAGTRCRYIEAFERIVGSAPQYLSADLMNDGATV